MSAQMRWEEGPGGVYLRLTRKDKVVVRLKNIAKRDWNRWRRDRDGGGFGS